jgi:hypothetical protein
VHSLSVPCPCLRAHGRCEVVGHGEMALDRFALGNTNDVSSASLYKGHRYPAAIISYYVWWYHQFPTGVSMRSMR